jgi:hypothetical protein
MTALIDRPIHETLDIAALATVKGLGMVIGGLRNLSSEAASHSTSRGGMFDGVLGVISDLKQDAGDAFARVRTLEVEAPTIAAAQSFVCQSVSVEDTLGTGASNGLDSVHHFFARGAEAVCAAR